MKGGQTAIFLPSWKRAVGKHYARRTSLCSQDSQSEFLLQIQMFGNVRLNGKYLRRCLVSELCKVSTVWCWFQSSSSQTCVLLPLPLGALSPSFCAKTGNAIWKRENTNERECVCMFNFEADQECN